MQAEIIAIGFYDVEGTFFYVWDSSRPDATYSYALAEWVDYYVVRLHMGEGPYCEIGLDEDGAYNLLDHIRHAMSTQHQNN